MRIYLLGLMGSGKTTIGKKLAKKLNYQFVDLDEVIEQKYGCSIAEYFEKYGEDSFRVVEQQTLRESFQHNDAVVSTGGGVPCFFNNMDEILEFGVSIYLMADVNLLVQRLKGGTDQRPLIKNKSIEELKEYLKQMTVKREVFYKRANLIIDAKDLTVEKILDELDLKRS